MKRRILLVMLIGLFPCIVFAGHLYAAERTYNVHITCFSSSHIITVLLGTID